MQSRMVTVIGTAAVDPLDAVSVQLDNLGFETQSWAFSPVHESR
ncbi:hypothetical protein [Variovorax paradoxus]